MDDHKEPWKEIRRFRFLFRLMWYADDKIRLHYRLVQDPKTTKAEWINTDTSDEAAPEPSDAELRNITFIQGTVHNS